MTVATTETAGAPNDTGSLSALKSLASAAPLDLAALRRFLMAQPEFGGREINVSLSGDKLSAGASGGTLLFRIEDSAPDAPLTGDYVMRYDLGDGGIFQATSLRSQFDLMRALHDTDIPAPDALWLDEEGRIVPGASVLIMRRVFATVPSILYLQEGVFAHADPARRDKMIDSLIGVVAKLHRLDVEALDVPFLHERGGAQPDFLAREIAWVQAELHSKFPEVEEGERAALHSEMRQVLDDAAQFLLASRPTGRKPVLVHGDVTLANTMFRNDGEVKALLDWELAHLGLPAEDIAYMTAAARGIANVGGTLVDMPGPDDLRARYEALGGDTTDWDYCDALGCWRVGVFGAIGMRRMPPEFWPAQARMWECHRDALIAAMDRCAAPGE